MFFCKRERYNVTEISIRVDWLVACFFGKVLPPRADRVGREREKTRNKTDSRP